MKERILVVDDNPEHCELMCQLVAQFGYAPTATTSAQEALELVGREQFDAVLTDLEMASLGGVELCARISAVRSDVPVIFVTGVGSMETAVEAMRAGAYDFLNKPIDATVLHLALRRALENRRLREEVKLLREVSEKPTPSATMLGESAAIRRVKDMIDRAGPSEVSVLIEGETGTGKELVARAVHQASPRSAHPFVAINCAAVPANLLESELFGHVRGAFTDAKSSRDGLFVRASGGTLFLDEIGEMPIEMQAKLLRALQERTIRPVGGDNEIPFDARIITATHRDLEGEIAEHRFREDLYYRINVVKIAIGPLRDRGNDILLLATSFLQRAAKRSQRDALRLSPQVARQLLAYDWPGNVRELENCIERAVALARLSEVSAEDLPEKIRAYTPKRIGLTAETDGEILSLDELERRYILRALKILNGNRSRVATVLGLDRRTLYRRLERYAQSTGSTVSSRGDRKDSVDEASKSPPCH